MEQSDKILLKHQRKMLGILCALLAPMCILFGLLGDNNPEWWYSISATYYTNSKMFLIGLLVTTSVYFLSYKGYDFWDNFLTTASAFFALGIVAFPCNAYGCPDRVGLFNLPVAVSHIVHCVSAAGLFTMFALMILLQFTQSGGAETEQKVKRNRIYRVCGWVIVAFELLVLANSLAGWPHYLTIVYEAVMLSAFSMAWLVKGEAFAKLNDEEEK